MNESLLPDKLSELGRLALKDMHVIKQNPNYRIEMVDWHANRGGICFVCLAGCVMANTLGAEQSKSIYPVIFGADIQAKLSAIDSLRQGRLVPALFYLGRNHPAIKDRNITWYDYDPKKWEEEMIGIIEELEAKGL